MFESTSSDETVHCDLPVFPGGNSLSTDVGLKNVDFPGPLPPTAVIDAAWATILHLYTNLDNVCFESKRPSRRKSIRAVQVREDDVPGAIVSRLQENSSSAPESKTEKYHFNTAAIYDYDDAEEAESVPQEDDESSLEMSLASLPDGMDAALHVTKSDCNLIYRHTLMSEGEATNVASAIGHILTCFSEPFFADRPVRELAISQRDWEQVTDWNSAPLSSKGNVPLHERFTTMAQKQPDGEVIDAWDGKMTWRELEEESNALGQRLRQRGVGPGSWVLFCFNKSRWAVVGMLAILKTGAAYVPVDPRHPEDRIRQIIELTGAEHGVAGNEETAALLSRSDSNLDVVNVLQNEEDDDEDAEPEWPDVAVNSPALCQFTSGSTGVPKGIIVQHAQLFTAAWEFKTAFGGTASTRVLQFSSHTFDACMADIYHVLLYGGTLCIPSEAERMDGLQDYILRSRANWATITPTVARLLDPHALVGTLDTITLVGELVKETDVAIWIDLGFNVFNGYGPAENPIMSTHTRVQKGRASNVGLGFNTRCWIVDMDKQRLVPVGAPGELVIEGPNITAGYLNNPEKTKAAFISDMEWLPRPDSFGHPQRRCYRTGDLVRQCEDGSLVVVGRIDNQVKLGGQRVELSDIEAHIIKNPETRLAGVFVPRAGPLKDRLICMLQLDEADQSTTVKFSHCDPAISEEAAAKLRKSLPAYMIPQTWMCVNRFPTSAAGKLDRKGLTARLEALTQEEYFQILGVDAEEEVADIPSEDTLNANQRLLRQVCSQVLNIPIESLSLNRSFVALGGDSITAMQVSAIARRTEDKSIGVKDLLSTSSLMEAASRVTALSAPSSIPIISAEERRPLAPIQRMFFDTVESSVAGAGNHFHQSMLLRITEFREPSQIKAALSLIMERHPTLRTCFEKQTDGQWMQYFYPESQIDPHLEHYPEVTKREDRDALIAQARESLSLTDGPMMRAQLFPAEEDGAMILFFLVHHAIIDLVSWRMVFEELEESLTIKDQSESEMRKQLASYQESVPFLSWLQLEEEMAQDLPLSQALPVEPVVPGPDFAYWGIEPDMNVYGDVKGIHIPFNEAITNNVLYDCHHALRTDPVDIFLAGILLSFKRAFPNRRTPPIFNEGHGREPWDDTLDISRTVGWFTTIFPVHVGDVDAGNVVEVVRRVKDYRKTVPANGFSYFSTKYLTEDGVDSFGNHIPAEILFNYEGRYQSLEKDGSILKSEDWEAGEALADQGPKLKRFCLFELSAAILPDGQLHFTVCWNTKTQHQSRINLWLTSMLPAAIGEIVINLMLTEPQFTLTDVAQLGMKNYDDVEALTDAVLDIPGVESVEDVEDIYAGSPMQDALALSGARSDDGAYEIEFTFELSTNKAKGLSNKIDVDILATAWNDTVARHAPLRTVILEADAGNSMLHQVVLKNFTPETVLLSARDGKHALEILSSYPSYKQNGLLVDKKPPHRLLICQTVDGKVIINFQVHHIIFDGMSTAQLISDLSDAYHARLQNTQLQKVSAKPFAEFIRYTRQPGRREESIAYWKDTLKGAEPCLFPALLDTAEVVEQKKQPGIVNIPFSQDAATLQRTLAKLEVTLPAFIQMAWALVLRMYTGSNQSVFGYLAAGRDAPIDGIETAVGPFISMLVSYVDFERDQDLTVDALVKKLSQINANSMAHQACSLADIQNTLNISGNTRLFNTGISMGRKITEEMQLKRGSALIFEDVSLVDPTEFDLALSADTGENGNVFMYLSYRQTSISDEHAKNISTTLASVLSELLQNPTRKPDEICAPSQQDMQKIWNWNQNLIQPLEKCTHDIFADRVMEYPDREAIYSWDGSLTYKQLDDLAKRLAKHLVSLGVGPEVMVPLCSEKSKWAIVSMLAVLKAGGCFVMLDPGHPEKRLSHLMGEVNATVVLCSPKASKAKRFHDMAADLELQPTVLEIDGVFMNQLPPLAQNERADVRVCSDVRPSNAMYVVFTSGTTGTPKGTVATHGAFASGLHEHAEATGMISLGAKARVLQFSSFIFDASLGDIFMAFEAGGCLCIPRDEHRNPADIVTFMAEAEVNWLATTPSFAGLIDPPSIPTLKVLVQGGEALSSAQVEGWSGALELINVYGPSECTVTSLANRPMTKTTSPTNIGRAMRGATWIVDPDNHNRLRPLGAIGELLIEGPTLCRGYLKRPEQTAKVFISAPTWLQDSRPNSRLYKTGDLVRYNVDGSITFIGRKDTQVKINGQRVEIGEIEHAMISSVGQSEATVVVEYLKRADQGESNLLAAFVLVGSEKEQAQEEGSLIANSPQAMSRFRALVAKILAPESAASSIPAYMMPQAYVPLRRLPLTTSSKVDRRALQQAAAQLSRDELVGFGTLSVKTEVAHDVQEEVSNGEHHQIAKLWKKVLGVKSVGRDSNFFRLGGNSMAAIALRSEARRAGLDLSVADIFAHPVLEDMVKVMFPDSPSSASEAYSSEMSFMTPSPSSPSTPPEEAAFLEPFSLLRREGISIEQELPEVAELCGVPTQEIEDMFPCTPLQEALMVLTAHNKQQGAYAWHAPFKLSSDVRKQQFVSAWEKTMRTHPILRSRIVARSQGGVVVVAKDSEPVKHVTVPSLEKYLEEQQQTTFQYGAPLFRLAMVNNQQDGYYYLVISAHHAIYDGWSIGLIWKTFLDIYGGKIAPFHGPSFQEFVEELSMTDKTDSQQYWQTALVESDDSGIPFPDVPVSHKPMTRAKRDFRLSFRPDTVSDLGVTIANLLQAAWAITLSQYSTSETVNFGITLSGRDFPMSNIDQLVGPTIVTVPRQLEVSPNQSVLDFLRHVQDVTLAALPHQHLGLSEIQGLGAAAKRACDFSSLMVVNEAFGLDSSLQTAGITPVTIDSAEIHPYPIVLDCSVGRQSIDVDVAFDPACIEEDMVSQVIGYFDHVLQTLHRCHFLDLATVMSEVAPAHLKTILGWNKHRENFPDPSKKAPVHEMLEEVASQQPHAPAIVSHDGNLTHADLHRCADILCNRILEQNLVSEQFPFISVCFDKSAAATVAMLATLKAGCAFTPLNPTQPKDRLQGLLEQSNSKIILASPEHCEMLADLGMPCKVIPVVVADIMAQKNAPLKKIARKTVKPNDAAYLMFTSGTTGKPKGVLIEHGPWNCAIHAQAQFFGLTKQTRMLQFSSYVFDASVSEIFMTLAYGGCVCSPSEYERMNDLVSRLLRPEELPNVDLAILAGEPLAQSDIDAWVKPGRRVNNAYGPTETTIMAAGRRILLEDRDKKKCCNIGHAVGNCNWVLSPQGSLTPIGAVGELCVDGPTLARGYFANPEKTADSFPAHLLDRLPGVKAGTRVYRTGDLVRYNADGTLDCLGRRDGQVKLRGQRIDVGEIEHHIKQFMSEHTAFQQANILKHVPSNDDGAKREPYLAALLLMDLPLDQEVAGIPCSPMLTAKDGNLKRAATDLRRKLRGVLPNYMVPSVFIAVGRMPTTPSGKLDSRVISTVLEKLSAISEDDKRLSDGKMTTSEEHLRKLWSDVLGVAAESFGRDGDFFALGGNSISAMRLVGLSRASQLKLQYEDIFAFPILSDMASCCSDGSDAVVDTLPDEPFNLLAQTIVHSTFEDALPRYGINKESVEDMYPCTPLQEALMAATSKHKRAYVMTETFDLPVSQLDQFKAAWASVFETFEILRTRIVLTHTQDALQVVLKNTALQWSEVADVDDFVKLVDAAFGYGNALAHLAVAKQSGDITRVFFSAHHALYDGNSIALVFDRLYKKMGGDSSTLQITPFKSFVKHLVGQNLEEAKTFWSEKLSGLESAQFPPRPRNLPASHQPLATECVQHTISLPSIDVQRKLGVTSATVCQAAWALTISHYTANTDTLFGSTLAGRESAASSIDNVESIAGPTITTIPFRTVIDYNTTVSKLLSTIQQDVLRATRFAQIGLQQIVRINDDCRQGCDFDSIFVVQAPGDELDAAESLGITRKTLGLTGFFPSPLVVDVEQSLDAKNITVTMNYDPVIMQGRMPELMLDTYMTILGNLFRSSAESSLKNMSALSAEHLSELQIHGEGLSDNNEAAENCLQDLVRKQVELTPSLTCIEAWDGSFTYAELDNLSSVLAQKLVDQGVGLSKAVAMVFEKSKWAIVAMLGIVKAGGYWVPLDPKQPQKRLEYLIETVEADIILTSPQNLEISKTLPGKTMIVNEITLPLKNMSALKPASALPIPITPHNTAYILFTSGSTGTPKGVVIEHGSVCSAVTALGKRMGLGPRTRYLQFSSFWFDGNLVEIFGTFINGGCVCIPSDDQRMNDLAGCIESMHVNTVFGAPSVIRLLEPEKVPSVKTICIGGEPVLQSDLDRWASKVKLLAVYGPTEATIMCTLGDLRASTSANLIGTAVECRTWIVNPVKDNELAPFGGVGELCIEGPNLARGYLNDEEKTSAAFIVNPAFITDRSTRVYKTGDLVYMEADGSICFMSRKDTTQVKIRGQRVELAEIEETIRQHIPTSITVSVDVFKSENGDDWQILGAAFGVGKVATAGPDSPAAVKYMQDFTSRLIPAISATLPTHMVPKVFIPFVDLPMMTTGKLDRKTLRKVATPMAISMSKGKKSATRQAPETRRENLLCSLWATVLKFEDEETISRWDNFFSRGGDSMMAMRLVALARHHGYTLTTIEIFQNPTLAAMAAVMKNEDGEVEDSDMEDDIQDEEVMSEKDIVEEKKEKKEEKRKSMRAEKRKSMILPIVEEDVDDGVEEESPQPAPEFTLINIESVYPCTDYQEVFMNGTDSFAGAHVVQFIFSLESTVDLARLRKAVNRCVDWFPTLRTRIVKDFTSGKMTQVVLPAGSPGTQVSWTISRAGDLESAIAEDKRNPPVLNHAAYDGWSLGLLLDCVAQVYKDPNFTPSHPLRFNELIKHVTAPTEETREFWHQYLAGVKPNKLLFNYANVENPMQEKCSVHRVALPKQLEKETTASSVIIAAWVMLLSRMTESKDITIANLVTGRAMPLPGIESCPGPAVSKAPLRIHLPEQGPELRLSDVAAMVRWEQVRVMPHEHAGISAIRDHIPAPEGTNWNFKNKPRHAGNVMGRLPLEMAIQPMNFLESEEGKDIGMRFNGARLMGPPPGSMSVECSLLPGMDSQGRAEVDIAVIWDGRAATEEDIEGLMFQLKDILGYN
ncbi:Apicidin F synthase [Cladobotryum mycophilum]|uniref:Apicidin F synthase n=1 Tax=Cladobotryum mycophilum TaxID=491253 RepID=A0ABR0SBI4_9HYPO